MRPRGVVVLSPRSDRRAGLIEGEEQRLIKQLVPYLAIEALDVAILHGLAPILRPGEDGVRGELGPAVADDQTGPASPFEESGEFTGHPTTGNRGVRDGRQALVGDVIYHVEDPEPPAIGHLVMHEVE